ncbi:MAG: hypothetical protein AAF655_09870 [Bacteroidota bacterium]
MEVRVIGINSQKISELIPTTADLSPSSISNALQAVASIKSHMHDKDVIIYPHIIAYGDGKPEYFGTFKRKVKD